MKEASAILCGLVGLGLATIHPVFIVVLALILGAMLLQSALRGY